MSEQGHEKTLRTGENSGRSPEARARESRNDAPRGELLSCENEASLCNSEEARGRASRKYPSHDGIDSHAPWCRRENRESRPLPSL